MRGGKVLLLHLIIYFIVTSDTSTVVQNRKNGSTVVEENSLQIFPNVKLQIHGRSMYLNWSLKSLFPKDIITNRQNEGKKKNPLRRIGSMIMMIPFAMQMMSLPGALGSIKTQLLRSLFVGKLALIMIIYNAIRNQMMKEVVVVHKVQPQHYNHYYHPDLDSEDSWNNWWGRRK